MKDFKKKPLKKVVNKNKKGEEIMSPFRSKEQRSFLKRTKPELYKKVEEEIWFKDKSRRG